MSRDITYTNKEAYAVQQLARNQMIEKLLADIRMDMSICELEGWDIHEYPSMIIDAIPRKWAKRK